MQCRLVYLHQCVKDFEIVYQCGSYLIFLLSFTAGFLYNMASLSTQTKNKNGLLISVVFSCIFEFENFVC